jgi:hypothetical protein
MTFGDCEDFSRRGASPRPPATDPFGESIFEIEPAFIRYSRLDRLGLNHRGVPRRVTVPATTAIPKGDCLETSAVKYSENVSAATSLPRFDPK